MDAALEGKVTFSGDEGRGLFDEERWAEFARVGAAHGVLSTLSMPIHGRGRVLGGVNLYAAAPHAFAGKLRRLAAVLGAWAPGAVLNADLSFCTRESARCAPGVLEEQTAVLDQATGVVVAAHDVDPGAETVRRCPPASTQRHESSP